MGNEMRLKHTRGKKMIQMRGGGEKVQQLEGMIANGRKRINAGVEKP